MSKKRIEINNKSIFRTVGLYAQRVRHLEVGLNINKGISFETVKKLAGALKLKSSIFSEFVGYGNRSSTSKLGNLVRSRRKEFGMSGTEFSKKLCVSRQRVSQIELGLFSDNVTDRTLRRLAKTLKLDVKILKRARSSKKSNLS